MTARRLSLMLGALIAAPMLASAATPMSLSEAVALIQSQFPGVVVAAELDATGDKPLHYHVDVRFAHGATTRLEVDATSRRIAARLPADELPAGAMTMADALAYVATKLPGPVLLAELDGSDGRAPHYHVDVRLQTGKVAHLRIDPVTRQIAWRNIASLDN